MCVRDAFVGAFQRYSLYRIRDAMSRLVRDSMRVAFRRLNRMRRAVTVSVACNAATEEARRSLDQHKHQYDSIREQTQQRWGEWRSSLTRPHGTTSDQEKRMRQLDEVDATFRATLSKLQAEHSKKMGMVDAELRRKRALLRARALRDALPAPAPAEKPPTMSYEDCAGACAWFLHPHSDTDVRRWGQLMQTCFTSAEEVQRIVVAKPLTLPSPAHPQLAPGVLSRVIRRISLRKKRQTWTSLKLHAMTTGRRVTRFAPQVPKQGLSSAAAPSSRFVGSIFARRGEFPESPLAFGMKQQPSAVEFRPVPREATAWALRVPKCPTILAGLLSERPRPQAHAMELPKAPTPWHEAVEGMMPECHFAVDASTMTGTTSTLAFSVMKRDESTQVVVLAQGVGLHGPHAANRMAQSLPYFLNLAWPPEGSPVEAQDLANKDWARLSTNHGFDGGASTALVIRSGRHLHLFAPGRTTALVVEADPMTERAHGVRWVRQGTAEDREVAFDVAADADTFVVLASDAVWRGAGDRAVTLVLQSATAAQGVQALLERARAVGEEGVCAIVHLPSVGGASYISS